MGVSTDGIIFYGVCYEDEGIPEGWPELEWNDIYEWEYYYAEKKGVRAIPFDSKQYDKDGKWKEEWYKQEKIISDMAKDSNVTIETHCSGDYPMLFIAVEETLIRAARGYPIRFSLAEVDKSWNKQLKDFCEIMGIPFDESQCGWWLCSYWG